MLITFTSDESIPSGLSEQHAQIAAELQVVRPNDLVSVVRRSVQETCDFFRKPYGRLKSNEKTVIGSKFEDNFKQAYDLPKYTRLTLDTHVAGSALDIKFTLNSAWMIPPSCINAFTLLTRGDVSNEICSLELVYIRKSMLPIGKNRDQKHTLKQDKLEWLGPNRWIVRPTKFKMD